MYLTYLEYKDMGGNFTELIFNRHCRAAEKEIDRQTQERLKNINPVPEDLRYCVFELIQRVLCGNLNGDDFTTLGAGKSSGTYEDRQKRINEIIRRYLEGMTVGGVPVFYLGSV